MEPDHRKLSLGGFTEVRSTTSTSWESILVAFAAVAAAALTAAAVAAEVAPVVTVSLVDLTT